MRLNKYLFNRVNNKERERGQRSVVWLKRSQPCLHHLHVLSTVFSWRPFNLFSLWIILLPPSLPPFILPLLNQCDGCLVPLAWWLMAGGHGFASHGGVTLSRGWPCQRWKPLDIPDTHLHSAMQFLKGWNVRRHLIVSNIVNAVLFLLCRLEREEDVESFLPPESLTFDVRVETDPRQVHIVICSQFQIWYYEH